VLWHALHAVLYGERARLRRALLFFSAEGEFGKPMITAKNISLVKHLHHKPVL
jgi:hypothetical protein